MKKRKKSAPRKSGAARSPKSAGGRAGKPLVPFDQIDEIVDFLERRGLEEFEFERDGLRVRLKRQSASPVMHISASSAHAPATPAEPPVTADAEPDDSDEGLHIVTSPIVGTFYEAPRPDAPVFVKVGDSVSKGQTLCIVEAMKLMNEIDSDVDGEIVRIYGQSGNPVEYGARLFAIRPT